MPMANVFTNQTNLQHSDAGIDNHLIHEDLNSVETEINISYRDVITQLETINELPSQTSIDLIMKYSKSNK
ncbi:MAG: hypothetical protein H3C45_06215 [Bacteroidia bacterium]|nr:hypothetical protein [Bacteroidia bacterium]MCC7532551.1 hypothetical protein [Bacteroidia bacterium]